MSTPQTCELGWLSYLSNILAPTGQNVGVKKNFARSARRICPPTFKTVAPPVYVGKQSRLPVKKLSKVTSHQSKCSSGLPRCSLSATTSSCHQVCSVTSLPSPLSQMFNHWAPWFSRISHHRSNKEMNEIICELWSGPALRQQRNGSTNTLA